MATQLAVSQQATCLDDMSTVLCAGHSHNLGLKVWCKAPASAADKGATYAITFLC